MLSVGGQSQDRQAHDLPLHGSDFEDWLEAGSWQCGGLAFGHGHKLVYFPPGCSRKFAICLLADPGRLRAESGDSPSEREGLEDSHFEEHCSAEGVHPVQAEA